MAGTGGRMMSSAVSLLNYCKTLSSVEQIHALISKTGLDGDPLFAGKLLLHCCATVSGSSALAYARRIFADFPAPDAFMYNALIRGYADSLAPGSSLHFFNLLNRDSAADSSLSRPDSFSFAFALKAAANLRCLLAGSQLHSQAFLHGLSAHLFVGTTLVSMYAECGSGDSAKKMFDEMRLPNVVAWNAMLTALFRCSDLNGALSLFDRMPFRNSATYNVQISGLMKAGEVDSALSIFDCMPLKDDVAWASVIVGLSRNSRFVEAFRHFRDMQRTGVRPTEVSLTGVLSACADSGAQESGKALHSFIVKAGLSGIVSVSNALLDAYSKCGDMGMAQSVFSLMSGKRTAVSWTAIISGLSTYGLANEAIRLLAEMEESGVCPDRITFISILYACSHAGLIQQGEAYFSKMRDVYGIEPGIEHYGCMVDLYGRAGKLDEAYEFVLQMPIEPTDIIWRTLLGACSIHGNVELGEKVRTKLSEVDPYNSGDQVLLSNIYATAGKWKDVAAVRKSMSNEKVKKTPGYCIIEVDKLVYSFVAGQNRGDVSTEAYQTLMEIMSRLREEGGYVPEVKNTVLHDIEEEEKESAVALHSEKLALAFGLKRSCKGKVLRMVKNLRICGDCHVFMKMVSRVYEVEIVVRDRSRFHSFKDGSCSCRDYW